MMMEWKWNYDPCPKMGMDNFHFVPSPDCRTEEKLLSAKMERSFYQYPIHPITNHPSNSSTLIYPSDLDLHNRINARLSTSDLSTLPFKSLIQYLEDDFKADLGAR